MILEFSTCHLVIGDQSPSAKMLNPIFIEADDQYSINDTHYRSYKENLDDKYFWLYARYGKSRPYSPTVFNTKDNKEENNPRNTDQIELDKQLFALYCVHSHILYLSNKKKQSVVEEYLKEKLEQNVVIKAFFTNVDKFIQKIKSVKKVKFVVKRNLFSSESEIMDIFPIPKNLYGLGMPEKFTLEANFANVRSTDAFVKYLKKMVGWKNKYEADSLLCIGRDNKNFETLFNADSFIQKVSVKADKDDQGFYVENSVKKVLISKIGGSCEEYS